MSRTKKDLRGILAAVTTPFTEDGTAIDAAALQHQVERLVAAGIHGIVPTGTTGEFTTLSADEYRRVIELYVKGADGRIPVIAGIGALSTQAAIDLAQHAETTGAVCGQLAGACWGESGIPAEMAAGHPGLSLPRALDVDHADASVRRD